MKKIFTTIIFSISMLYGFSQGSVRGFVYDKESGEPIIFTNVFFQGTTIGVSTDVNGYFSITKIPKGDYTLMTTSIGYDTASVKITIINDQIITHKLYIKRRAIQMKEVEITAEKQEAQSQVKMSVVKITPKEIKSLPTVGGEADIAQYLQVLPGVVFTGDQGGQLYIRGGSPIQNKVLLDGMIVYNPFHTIGLFSVFDTDIIRNADIYTGGFNAEYGGRISSIMDITTRDGSKKKVGGKIGISPFGAKAMLEGPLKKQSGSGGSSSFIFSGKTSYLEQSSTVLYKFLDNSADTSALFNTWEAPPTGNLPFNYTDLYGKLSFNGANGSKANFFGFNFRDRVNFQGLSDLRWDSYGGGSNFLIIPGESSVLIEGVFAFSSYLISLAENEGKPRSSGINGFNGGLDFSYFMGDNQLKYGLEIISFFTEFKYYNQIGAVIEQSQSTNEIGGYVSYKWKTKKAVIEPSFRLHYYASLNTPSAEPRIGLKYNISDKLRFKAAGGIYSQNLMSAESSKDVINLFYGFLSGSDNLQDSVKLANGRTRPVRHSLQKANHFIAGFEFDLNRRININVEGYLKQFTQLTALNRNKIYNENSVEAKDKPDVEKKDFIVETGDAMGVDFVLKYDYKRTYIWFVYSLGKVTRFDGVQEDLEGNLTPYFPVFDKRHNFNFVASYKFGKNLDWEFNARWNLGSGFPFTPNQGIYGNYNFNDGILTDYTTQNPELEVYYGQLNSARLPMYHRMDVNLKRVMFLTDNITFEANAGVTNIYNRENVFYFDRVKFKRVNQLPLMPSIGLSLSF
jgi:hypothetical protein